VDAVLGLPVLVGLIAVALLFDFLNGLHDAANSIATMVSTRVLRPQFAALVGAIVWNIVTWALGIPSFSSHALIGITGAMSASAASRRCAGMWRVPSSTPG
jgi:PiT family inorganic phosphate transporter